MTTTGDGGRTGFGGRALLTELRQRARTAGCRLLELDSATSRADAHRFYMRERMSIIAFHFAAEL